ncbi:MAG: hypothetical protein R6V54_12125, partial [Desulfobacteraceae bacterium]
NIGHSSIWRANGVRLLLLTLSDRKAQSNHKAHDNVNNEKVTPLQGGRCYDQARLMHILSRPEKETWKGGRFFVDFLFKKRQSRRHEKHNI